MSASDTITIRIDPDLKKQIEKAAKADDRSFSSYLIRALRCALEETAPISIEVVDIAKDKAGPWRLMVNGYGVASWPSPKSAEPKVYAEEAARVLRKAIR